MKQFLSKEQAQILIDMGVDMGNCNISHRGKVEHYYPETWDWDMTFGSFKSRTLEKWYIPTLTIGQLIERLPIMFDPSKGRFLSVPHERVIAQNAVMYMCPNNSCGYSTIYKFADRNYLIDNLYDCYVQLIKDGVIKL